MKNDVFAIRTRFVLRNRKNHKKKDFFLQIVLVLRCCCSLYFVLNSNPQWSHLCILFLELKLALVLRRFILRFLQNVKKKMERREKAIILAIFCEGEKKNKNRLEMSSSSKKIARFRGFYDFVVCIVYM